MTTALVHPGVMGASLGSALRTADPNEMVLWASDGRSVETLDRASAAGLTDAGDLASLVAQAGCIVSVCPPAAAIEVAQEVSELGFDGIYVDANAGT